MGRFFARRSAGEEKRSIWLCAILCPVGKLDAITYEKRDRGRQCTAEASERPQGTACRCSQRDANGQEHGGHIATSIGVRAEHCRYGS